PVLNRGLRRKVPLGDVALSVETGRESEGRPGPAFTHHCWDGDPAVLVDLAAGGGLRKNNEVVSGSAIRGVIVDPGIDVVTQDIVQPIDDRLVTGGGRGVSGNDENVRHYSVTPAASRTQAPRSAQ